MSQLALDEGVCDGVLGRGVVAGLDVAERELLAAAMAEEGRRVRRVVLPSRVVWVKRAGVEGYRSLVAMQRCVARVLGVSALEPSPWLSAVEMADREVARMEGFRARGFLVPTVLWRDGATLVLSDLGASVEKAMRSLSGRDGAAHDAMLVRCAGELGRIHAAGLCHGRPHPRDFIASEDRFGVIDFEEAPDSVMPLEAAQGRDLWLLFMQICSRCESAETMDRAYEAWAGAVSREVVREVGALVDCVWRVVPAARMLTRIRPWKDIVRFQLATEFLRGRVG